MSEAQVRPFQAEVAQVLKLVVNSLYSHKEIFLRELVSNASDALDKLRFEALSDAGLVPEDVSYRVRLTPDADNKTLTISDNGIGMSEEELIDNLGTIARSGTREFIDKISAAKASGDVQLIGQFGVGFYSAFLVAERVEVISRKAGQDDAFCWASDAQESYSIAPAERAEQGTDVILHLAEDQSEFLQGYKLRELIGRYSDYVGHPIEMPKVKTGEDEKAADADAKDASASEATLEFEQVNQAAALWTRSPKEVEQAQYDEFYKHLTHDWEAPLAHRHFHVEGTQLFTGLLFLPKRRPFDLFDTNAKHGVRLHVKRVFVMDDCDALMPKYLRFVRGLVDSEDLPLNVSREILQDSRLVRVIRKQVVNHCLSMLETLQADKPEQYREFWDAFGSVLKEGLHFSEQDKDRIAKLALFQTTNGSELTPLAEYVSRMKEGQKAIYYATGSSRELLEASPHLEKLKKHGYEVLLLTEPVDPFAISGLGEFDGKSLVSATDEKLELDDEESEEDKKKREESNEQAAGILERMKTVLAAHISEVKASDRLTDSPVCLVTAEGGVAPHIEAMMRAQNPDYPKTKRILEVNTTHPVIQSLTSAMEKDGDDSRVNDRLELLYDQALISEGSPVDDPGAFSKRLSKLMEASPVSG